MYFRSRLDDDPDMPEDQALQVLDREIKMLFDGGRMYTYGLVRAPGESYDRWTSRQQNVYRREQRMEQISSGLAVDPGVILYTYGVCRPTDPGTGIIAWKAYENATTTTPLAEYATVIGPKKDSVWIGYEALINALRWAYTKGYSHVLARCSSQDVCNQLADLWSVNRPELAAQRDIVKLARGAFTALCVEHYSAYDMSEVAVLAAKAYHDYQTELGRV